MDTELQALIQKIQDEGVSQAKAKANAIVAQAEHDAQVLREEAQKEADALIADAHKEVARLERTAHASLRQASRDILLGTRAQVEGIFAKLLEARIGKALDSEAQELIASVLRTWVQEPEGASVEINGAQASTLSDSLRADFKDMVAKGLEIRPFPQKAHGFTLSLDGGASYTDIQPDALVALFSSRVNDEIASLISVSEEHGGQA